MLNLAFFDTGAEVRLASIAGGSVPVDLRSAKPKVENEASVERFLSDAMAMAKFENT